MTKVAKAEKDKKSANTETPLMKQYNTIKGQYPDAILLFRVGDFYETFGSDAVKAAQVLGIVLTKRNNGYAEAMELAGFPHHSLDTYLPKLVRAGHRVAICDQLEDPKLTKTIVKRGVTELVTPGVTYNDKVLEHKANNFLCSLHINENKSGVAFLDISTGEFMVAEGSLDYMDKLIQNFKPSEIIFQKNKKEVFKNKFGDKYYTFCLDDWAFKIDFAKETLIKKFNTSSLKGFGIDGLDNGIIAAGAALQYLSDTQHHQTGHISGISRIEEDKFVWLDKFTIRNLELAYSTNENAVTLLNVLDDTITPMGSRLLKRWLALPLKEIVAIKERQDVVDWFMQNREIAEEVRNAIQPVGDLERLISKVAVARVTPREVVQLKKSLQAVSELKLIVQKGAHPSLLKIAEQLNPCDSIKHRIEKEIVSDPPMLVNRGGVIAGGVDAALDELRKISYSGKDYLIQIQQRESERTGIPSLKVAYNNVFGYYLEVTNVHKNKVPSDWIRKQTLTNAERYITEELKQYEEKILGAEEKIIAIETRLFNELVAGLADYITPVQLNATLIARIDCLLSFASVSNRNSYIRPGLNESYAIEIKNGRHPVIEKQLPIGEVYVANDIYLDNDNQQVLMITGPNMSGKSALLRQTALIVLLAQIGCFVPADKAEIGIVDKIFTRVGASDNISSGESTFMVEMNETASILNNLSNRSLILLDEIGRGTSTYDGISIAWAIAEFIHESQNKAKTLFATHYHELNDMSEKFVRIKNFNVSVRETGNKIIFTRKLVPGGSEHSFGIHVAQMAGMPSKVVARAKQILIHLEAAHHDSGSETDQKDLKLKTKPAINSPDYQLSFFQLDDPVLSQIKEEILRTDINTLTPVEALMKLNEIKKLLGK